ncbi:MAG: hypothetical protein DRO23_00310 [Thermoprotei archaeon]|nr:MAG: hypothetical protein DRO23_00310 [Thermoprotei archaeon]
MLVIHDVVTAAISSILLEVSATPKPGNIHRYHDFPDTKFEHFMVTAASMHKSLLDLASKAYESAKQGAKRKLDIGKFIYDSVCYARKWYVGGNTNLGTSTILSIEVPATIYAKVFSGTYSPQEVSKWAKRVAKETTVEDAIYFYKAIREVTPSYLGKVRKAPIPDVFDPLFEEKLRKTGKSLWDIWEYSSSWDLVSKNCVTGLKTIIEGYNTIMNYFKLFRNWNLAVISAYLELLSKCTDSLILRKHGLKTQERVNEEAKVVLETLISNAKKGMKELRLFDNKLYSKNINPGSIADIIAGSIMLALLNGLKP